ncbi:hypothetical protein JTB14_017221 [Gonioctena quinquepunctata]|nr:hypothetical protein JTB14_017221 [Gonioctena quinquepunctata]
MKELSVCESCGFPHGHMSPDEYYATIENVDEQNYDVNINDEAPMELNDEFFEYVDHIFQQFEDEELG